MAVRLIFPAWIASLSVGATLKLMLANGSSESQLIAK